MAPKITLDPFTSGDCESRVEFFVDDVAATNTASDFFRHTTLADSGRTFTSTFPYTDTGTAVQGTT